MKKSDGLGAKKALVINSVSSIFTIVLQITVLVWVNRFLLQRIEPEEYAIFPLVMSIVLIAEVLKQLFVGGLSRFIVEADARGDDDGVTRIVSSMFPFLVGSVVMFSVIGALVVWKIDWVLEIAPEYVRTARMMFALVVSMLLAGMIAGPFSVGLYAKQKFLIKNALDLVAEVVRIAVLAGLLLGVSASVMWLVVASTTAQLLRTVMDIYWTRRLIPAVKIRPSMFDRDTARSLLGFGAWTSVGGAVQIISRTVPLLLLNRFGTAVDVTCLYLGRLPDLQLRKVISAGMVPIQPAMTSLYAREGLESLSRIYLQGNRYTLWFALVGIAPLMVFAGPIIEAYVGNTFIDAAWVMLFLLGRYPLIFASAMFYRVAHASARVGQYFVTEAVIQVATLVAMYVLVVRMGMGAVGAAIAIGASASVLQLVLTWPLGMKMVGVTWRQLARFTLLPGMLPFAGAAGFCFAYRMLFPLETWHMIGIGSVLAVLVFVAILLRFCLEPEDRQLVAAATKRLRPPARGNPGLDPAVESGGLGKGTGEKV